MKKLFSIGSVLLLSFTLFYACKKEAAPGTASTTEDNAVATKKNPGAAPTVTVFATGLNNPRGLKFGPDGNLYVAEAGVGGTESTAGICPTIQVAPPVGPYRGSATGGRVSMINMNGQRSTVTTALPSSFDGFQPPSVLGPSDVAFMGNTLYVLVAGAGCSHGVATRPNGIYRVNSNGTVTNIADLGKWLLENPSTAQAPDLEPEGVWYSMLVDGDRFYTIEPNQGILASVTTGGSIEKIADLNAEFGHLVPTALAQHGNFYVGNLGTFPIMNQSAIYKVTPSGNSKVVVSGFSAILGLVMDGPRMYVLETSFGTPTPAPGMGRIVKVEPNGDKSVIASGLSLPTAMTMGPDGNLYVSNWGFGMPPGGGQIVKVTLNN